MKTLIVSDIHANAQALGAVLRQVQRKRIARIICLGDLVGYGGDPNRVLDRLRTFRGRKFYVRGNHDRVAAGFDDGAGFNGVARAAALWTRDRLSRANRTYLRGLPLGPLVDADGVMICHGSPFDEDWYMFREDDARTVFENVASPVIFFGHTHLPVVFSINAAGIIEYRNMRLGGTVELEPDKRYLINPGSVGQPRDRDSRSAFAIYETDRRRVTFYRTTYDLAAAQQSIRRAGLPEILADRLAVGT